MTIPKPEDPIVIGGDVYHEDDNGDIVTMSLSEYTERRVSTKLTEFRPIKTLSLEELPDPDAKEQIAISVVVSLVIMGITPEDIAVMTEAPISEIRRIIASGPAQVTFEKLFQSLINVNASTLQGRIAAYGDNAVSVVARTMNNEDASPLVQLKAAQDILDRAGTSERQFFSQSREGGGGDDELRITVFDEQTQEKKVEVEISKKK